MWRFFNFFLLLGHSFVAICQDREESNVCSRTGGHPPSCWRADELDDDEDDVVPLAHRQPLPGAAPLKSEGCGKPLRWPDGATTPVVMPLDDPLLIDPYREFMVYLPKGYNNSVPLPVVYGFHGYYSSAQLKMHDDRFIWKIENDLAKKGQQGFILVYGQGMADCGKANCWDEPYPQRSWNVWGLTESPGPNGPTCDSNRYRFGRYGCYTSCRIKAGDPTLKACNGHDHCHAASCVNDTLYAETLLQTIESKLCVDKRRQYVNGMSVGGMMAYWMASHFTERFAAAIPVAGSALHGFWKSPKMAIPLMDIHGTEDKTIPANYSNGFIALGPHSTGKPMVVPNCTDCAFSDDGFYYMPNYNITRDIAIKNNCECTGYGAQCEVKPWPTRFDGTKLANEFNWTCFQSFGNCNAENDTKAFPPPPSASTQPVVRCTWAGKHFEPIHGNPGNFSMNGTIEKKHHWFAHVAWDFFSQFYIREGSDKEAILLAKTGEPSSQTVANVV